MTETLYALGMGRGSDPTLLADELLWYIKSAIRNHPRSLQTAIGPSEIGHPCARRLGYKMLGHPTVNPDDEAPWLPTIGTAVHAWLADVFVGPRTAGRFLVEAKVCAGQVNGDALEGSSDLYDIVTATVVDWKIVGATTLKRAKASGPGDQYRTQLHTYGRGFELSGLPVDRVMIAYLPRNGELRDSVFWSEPYDPTVADDGMARVTGLAVATSQLGPAVLALLPTADAFCHRCPYFMPGSVDVSRGCPGHPRAMPIASGPLFGAVT